MHDGDGSISEHALGKEMRTPETIKTISDVRKLLLRIHPDQLGSIGAAAEVGHQLIPLLNEILKYPNDLQGWSPEIRAQYPKDAPISLTGLSPDNSLRPLRAVPLRRPEILIKMLQSYLDTGEIPEELAADTAEGSEEESQEQREADETSSMFLDMLDAPESFDHILGIRGAMNMYPPQNLRNAGVFKKFDLVAERMIAEEIATGTPDKLQLANTHLNEITFFDKKIGERLRAELDGKAQSSNTDVMMAPSNVTEWETRAAEAVSKGSVKDLENIANEVRSSRTGAGDEMRYSQRTIDTMAKNMFVEACDKNTTIDEFTSTFTQARQFPFSNESYADDIRTIVEMRAKYFVLGKIGAAHTPEELETIEEAAFRFPFQHDENITDLRNEFIIVRERMRGNAIGVEHVDDTDRFNQDARRLDELGFIKEDLDRKE